MTVQPYPGSISGKIALFTYQIAILMLLAAFVVPACILGYEAFTWLRQGSWPTLNLWQVLNLGLGWQPRDVSWVGVQKILDTILDTQVSLVAFIGLVLVAGFVAAVANAFSQEDRRLAEAWRQDQWKRDHINR